MPKMKAVQVPKPGADFEIVEREIPEPSPGHVRIRVPACGICHSDVVTKDGLFPGISYPRVPGHEVAGVIDEIGAGVKAWKKGERVGVGWFGGQDGTCPACRRGDFMNCASAIVCGISYDGGYQQFMVAPTLKYEPGTIVADGDFVIVHGRFSGFLPVNWIAADILRIKEGVLDEHWDVIQDEATKEESNSGLPMFGDTFPK